jgi:thioredoxin-like negative regulator of GroEL
LKKGRGFEAYVLLNEYPDSPQKEQADKLLPLARFLFDMGDGDGLTGSEALDEQYLSAAGAMRKRKAIVALDHLFAALEVGEEFDTSYTIEVIESLFSLLGEGNQTVEEYRQRLPVTGS